MVNKKILLLLTVLLVTVLTLALDRFVYGYLIFQPDNHTGWNSFRWYNFEYQTRQLEKYAERKEGEKFILFVGSSIAQYSYHKQLLEKELNRAGGPRVKVDLLSHASMAPTDFYYYQNRIKQSRPDLVVYITNPADLDLEQYSRPWEAGPVYSEQTADDFLAYRAPMLKFYPGQFAIDQGSRVKFFHRLKLLLHQSLWSLRFNADWYDSIAYSIKAGKRGLKHFYSYQGADIPETLWRTGMSGACVSLSEKILAVEKHSLLLQVPGELKMKEPGFQMELFRYKPQSNHDFHKCIIPTDAVKLRNFRPSRSGWQTLKIPTGPPDSFVFIRMSHVLNLLHHSLKVEENSPVHIGKAVRFSGNLGREKPPLNDYYNRRRFLEDEHLEAMNDAEYIKDFEKRVQPDDWRLPDHLSVWQFNQIRLSKYYLNWYDFQEDRQFRDFKNAVTGIAKTTPVLVINNAENKLTLDDYDDSPWYRGYLKKVNSLAKTHKNLYFSDLRKEAKLNHFSDAHHLTYDGMVYMTPIYAREIKKIPGFRD